MRYEIKRYSVGEPQNTTGEPQNTTTVAKVSALEYQGSWMDSRYLNVTVKSATELTFKVGDYVMYRGEKFELRNAVGIKKVATSGSYGEAFTYSNVKFESFMNELASVKFLNYTFTDSAETNVSGTLTTNFNFHCVDARDLVTRVKANMARALAQGMIASAWTFDVSAVAGYGNTDVTIDVDNISCLEALKKVYDEFGLSFVVSKTERKVYVRKLENDSLDQRSFAFGKGNGLRDIERTVNSDYELITRLRVVGSEKNMPNHWYYKKSCKRKAVVKLSYYEPTVLDTKKCGYYITHATVEGTGKEFWFIGVKLPQGVVLKSGSTVKAKFGQTEYTFEHGNYDHYTLKVELEEASYEVADWGTSPSSIPTFTIEIGSEYLTSVSTDYEVMYDGDANMLPNKALMPTVSESTNKSAKDPYFDSASGIEAYGLREGFVEFASDDDANGIEEIYPTIGNTNNAVTSATTVDDDGVYDSDIPEGMKQFNVVVPLDFNLKDTQPAGQSELGTLCMTSGKCGGREFKIQAAVSAGSGGYRLTCDRVQDDGLDIFFPNKHYPIASGDTFVITDIEMPESYITVAEQKLATAAKAYLAEHDHPHYNYNVSMDNIYIARQYDTMKATEGQDESKSIYMSMKEGDVLILSDNDLLGSGNTESISIDKLTIKEQEGKLPQFSVTLRNEKKKGTIANLEAKIRGGVVSKGSVNASETEKIADRIFSTRAGSMEVGDTVVYTPIKTSGEQLGKLSINGKEEVIYGSTTSTDPTAYHKPQGGIPQSDLASSVQNMLHSHSNKDVLDDVTQEVIDNSHSHSNKEVLDQLTQTQLDGLHTHANKAQLDNLGNILETKEIKVSEKSTLNGKTTIADLEASKAKVTGDTQLQDTTFGTFVTDNSGAKIDADGDAEMESLKLRSFLEVPELRFNRASVIAGSTIQSPCGGVIKTVTPTNSYTGIAELELGDDDIAGSIAVGDYCWGYWHDMDNKSNNATADYDDKKGTIRYKGFATVYFQVAEILNSNSTRFRYELKEGTSLHPYVGMHFGGRGNSVDKTRQGFTIITPNYQATYQLVSGWNWDAKQHIVRVSGLLDGFEALSDNNEWTSTPCFGTIETNLFLRNSYEELHNQYDSIFITQSSNGMLMVGETETISIVIRNQIFSDQSMDNYTFTLNGTAVQAVNREVKFTVSFSDLTQEVTTYKFVAKKKTGSGTLTQDIKVRKLMLDYHIETFKAAVNPVNDMMNDFLFDSSEAVQTDDAKAIASVESGSSIYAKRMIGTEEYSALGVFCCKIDNEDEYEYTDGDEIPVQRTNDVFNFTWYTDSTKTKIIHSKEVPVVHDSYDVKVFTRDGTFRIEKGKDNTLIAEVWSGNENITDKLSNYQFSWERISADTGGDTLWNSKHKNVGKTITIADADITRKAVFECVVDL